MTDSLNPLVTHPLREFIEDLIEASIPFVEIEKYALAQGASITAAQIEDYASNQFQPDDDKAYRVALKKQKIRETDKSYESGHVALQNSINIINFLLEQIMNRWRLLMEESSSKKGGVQEKDLLSYTKEIRETAKLVHELNTEIKDDNYIPIDVFYQEVEKFIGVMIGYLNKIEKTNPGLSIKDGFLVLVKEKFKQMEISTTAQISGHLE